MTAPGLHPISGDGVLSRHGPLILLCSLGGATDAVLAAHAEVAHAGGDGTALADRLAALLAGTSGVDLVALGPTGSSVVVAVFGHAWADVATEHGEQRLALRQSSDGVRSVLPGTLLSVRAGLGDVDVDAVVQQWGNLEHGSVHAAGFLFAVAAGAAAASEARPASKPVTAELPVIPAEPPPEAEAPAQSAESAPPGPASVPPAQPPPSAEPSVEEAPPTVDRSVPFVSVILAQPAPGDVPQASDRAPLSIAAPAPEPAPDVAPQSHPVEDHGVEVLGVYCKNGHFDDPYARYCAVCGISMAQLTLSPRLGPRPPLGVLVLDDGSIFSLETDYVVGRDPSRDERVVAGTARPLRVADRDGLTSRAHLHVHLDGWQVEVVDLGSANGTRIWDAQDSAWRLAPRLTPVPIRPGTQVGFGDWHLRYESHRGN